MQTYITKVKTKEEWPVFTYCHPAVGIVTSEGELSGPPVCLQSLPGAHALWSKC